MTLPTTPPFQIPIRVYIEDTDAGGIVYYVNYLKYMERARTEFLRSLGYDKPAFGSDNNLYVVASAEVRYRQSAYLDDQLYITAEIERIGKSFMVFRQRVFRDGQLLCEASVKIVNVCQESRKPKSLTPALKQQLLSLQQDHTCDLAITQQQMSQQ